MNERARLIGLLLIAGCGPREEVGLDAGARDALPRLDGGGCIEATFPSIHDGLLSTTYCSVLGCHAGGNPAGMLNLGVGPDGVYEALLVDPTVNPVGTSSTPNRVVPGSPAESFLWIKVSDPDAPGGQMRPGAPIEDCEMDAIREWIEAGATRD